MTSLTPVAMPTADRKKERERERAREVEGGGREWEEVEGGGEAALGLNSLLTLPGQGDRQAGGGYEKEQNAVEFPGAGGGDGGRRVGGCNEGGGLVETGIHLLNSAVSDARLSRRDSASFKAFTACRASARETETNSLLIGIERLLPTVGQREKSATREIDGS